jgi:hypothetical protein
VSLKTWHAWVEAEFVCQARVRLTWLELRRMMVPKRGVAAVSQPHTVCHYIWLVTLPAQSPTLRPLVNITWAVHHGWSSASTSPICHI